MVSMRLGDTPVLIPNTMVKTQSADGTIPETVWESRWMPIYGDVAQLGEHLPCKQGVESSNLFISIAKRLNESFMAYMYLENCIPNEKLYKYFIIRHPRY